MEEPKPSQFSEDLSADNGSERGGRVLDEVLECYSCTTLMHEIHVTDRGNHQGLECACGETLDDACCEKVVVANLGFANCCSNDVEESRSQEHRSFAILSTEGTNDGSRAASREEIIARDENYN